MLRPRSGRSQRAPAGCYSDGVHAIGIDVGGTEIKAGLVDEAGRVLASASGASNRGDLGALVDAVAGLAGSVTPAGGNPAAVGVGVPGLVRPGTGRVESAPNMPALRGAAIGPLLSERSGLDVEVRNDADMNAWGEFAAGAGRGSSRLVCLTVGTGLGSGVILDGRLYEGASGHGAEAGHIVVDPNGAPCGCGGRGCLETVVSATGVVALARERIDAGNATALSVAEGALTARRVRDAAAGGDALAIGVWDDVGRCLGVACATLINLLGPDTIIIGGGVAAAGAMLLDPALAEARARAYPPLFAACRIVPAELGQTAGVVGAALLAGRRARESSLASAP